MKQNPNLNNTCILFDKDNIAQQEAIIKYYNDGGYPRRKGSMFLDSNEEYIGVWGGELNYWWNCDKEMRIIDLPKEYYPIEQTCGNCDCIEIAELKAGGSVKNYPCLHKDISSFADKKAPIDNIVEDVKSELTYNELLSVLKGLVSDVNTLLSDNDIEWQQAGYYNEAKRLIELTRK